MHALYALDYAVVAIAIFSMALAARHILFQRSPAGWLLVVALLPIAGPICYAIWNAVDAARQARIESGRLVGAEARRARDRVDALLRERSEGVLLPAQTLELGRLNLALGATEEAEKYLGEYAERFPEEPEASYLLGKARAKRGQWREAVVAFQDAAMVDPTFRQGDALVELARGFDAIGDLDRARMAIDEALKHFAYPEMLCEAGRLAEKAEDFDSARALFERARRSAGSALGATRRAERRWSALAENGLRRANERLGKKE